MDPTLRSRVLKHLLKVWPSQDNSHFKLVDHMDWDAMHISSMATIGLHLKKTDPLQIQGHYESNLAVESFKASLEGGAIF